VAPLVAMRLTVDGVVVLTDGRTIRAQAGEWVITRGKQAIEIVGAEGLAARYTLVDSREQHLSGAICDQLDAILGIGATQTPEKLLAAVDRLARIEIGEIKIDFTPGQLEEISRRAKKRGWTVAQGIKSVVDRIREDLFWRS
jgi:hypothetical protein